MKNVGSHLLFFLLCFSLLISKTDAHYAYGVTRCLSNADDHDLLYTLLLYYNKKLLMSYNSTAGEFIGYTEKLEEVATAANKYFLQDVKHGKEECKQAMADLSKSVEAAAQEPQVRVFSVEPGSSQHPGVLVCSAYNFYPKPITLTWLRNDEEVMSGVTVTDEMSNANWLYQKQSYLEYTPTEADHISCMVEHASLSAPKLYPWEAFPESRRNKLTIGTAGLLLGLAFIIVGVIYKKRREKQSANPQGREVHPCCCSGNNIQP